jgi:hypothetical protein
MIPGRNPHHAIAQIARFGFLVLALRLVLGFHDSLLERMSVGNARAMRWADSEYTYPAKVAAACVWRSNQM